MTYLTIKFSFYRLTDSGAGRARAKDTARRAPGRAAPRPPAAREPRRVLSVDARPYSPQVNAILFLMNCQEKYESK